MLSVFRSVPLELANFPVLIVPVFFLIAGCGNSEKSFHPPAEPARSALSVALKAWQDGQAKPGLIESHTPPIQVSDPAWIEGQKLTSFEIVSEEIPTEGPAKFTVKLTVEGVADVQSIVYVVYGKSPLWIMREDEFIRTTGM
jgi:hypothetical protein